MQARVQAQPEMALTVLAYNLKRAIKILGVSRMVQAPSAVSLSHGLASCWAATAANGKLGEALLCPGEIYLGGGVRKTKSPKPRESRK